MQCSTQLQVSSSLYQVQGLDVIAVNSGCQYQYVPHHASSPLCCHDACEASQRCSTFSFSETHGCRLSACNTNDAIGRTEACGVNVHVDSLLTQCRTHAEVG